MLLVADRDVHVINGDGELLAEFTIAPDQAPASPETARTTHIGCPGCHATGMSRDPTHATFGL